jgi:hypothetical protein
VDELDDPDERRVDDRDRAGAADRAPPLHLLDQLDDDALPSAEQFLSTLEPLRTLGIGA